VWKTCGNVAEDLCDLCSSGSFFGPLPVHFDRSRPRHVSSHLLSLAPLCTVTRIVAAPLMNTMPQTPTAKAIRRTGLVNGRSYAIEIVPIAMSRWRARLAQRGTTNAVMPFYGSTPDEAFERLTAWLARVGRPAAHG
jgi:hypothetical protein